jgi:hypothetical protein
LDTTLTQIGFGRRETNDTNTDTNTRDSDDDDADDDYDDNCDMDDFQLQQYQQQLSQEFDGLQEVLSSMAATEKKRAN